MDDTWGRMIETRVISLERGAAVDQVCARNVEARLAEIEDTLKWLVRLIFGALVLSVLAFAMRGGLQVGGAMVGQ